MIRNFISVFVILLFTLNTSCKKSGGEHSYRPHLSAAHDIVLIEHTVIQVAATYIKAIHDSVLMADGYSWIDEAHAYLNPEEDIRNLKIAYDPWGVPDPYKRYRKGTITARLPDIDFMVGHEVLLTFDTFLLDEQLIDFERFAVTRLSESASADSYRVDIEGGRFISEDKSKDIDFTSVLELDLHHSNGQHYFKPDDWFSVNISSAARTAYFFEVESKTEQDIRFGDSCSYFTEGTSLILFNNLSPDSGYFSFGESSGKCQPYFQLDLTDVILFQSIDWLITAPETKTK